MIQEISDRAYAGDGPAEILSGMSADERFRGQVPKLRTIKKYAALAKRGAVSDPWSFVDAPADDVALVVPVIAAVIEASEGRVRGISKAEASVVARIVRAAPSIPPWDAYRLARRILADPDAERDVTEYLSFEPWRDPARYRAAYAARWVRHLLLVDPAMQEVQRYETPEEALRGHHEEGDAP